MLINAQEKKIKIDHCFNYPKLISSNGRTEEIGFCTFKWIKLFDLNKNKLMWLVRFNKNTVSPSNLEMQKAQPALALFQEKLHQH